MNKSVMPFSVNDMNESIKCKQMKSGREKCHHYHRRHIADTIQQPPLSKVECETFRRYHWIEYACLLHSVQIICDKVTGAQHFTHVGLVSFFYINSVCCIRLGKRSGWNECVTVCGYIMTSWLLMLLLLFLFAVERTTLWRDAYANKRTHARFKSRQHTCIPIHFAHIHIHTDNKKEESFSTQYYGSTFPRRKEHVRKLNRVKPRRSIILQQRQQQQQNHQ